jgi:hypothetical protein
MALSEFDILDKLVRAGKPLKATHLGGNSSDQKEFRAQMAESGLLKLVGKSFAITTEGMNVWRKSATPEQIEEASRREEEKRQQEIRDFLNLIRRKKGKLTTKEMRTVSEEVLVGSINQDLVRREGLLGTFEILPKGEALLLADQPLDKQINILRESHENLMEKLKDTQKEIVEELESLESTDTHSLQPEIVHLGDKIQGMEATFDALLHELSGLNHLIAAGRKFKTTIIDQANELLREIRDTREKTSALAQKAQQALKEQQTKLEAFEKQISTQLTAFDRQLIEKLLTASSPSIIPVEPSPTTNIIVMDREEIDQPLPGSGPPIDGTEVNPTPEKTSQRQLVDQI